MAPRPDDADSVPDGDIGAHPSDDAVTRSEDDAAHPAHREPVDPSEVADGAVPVDEHEGAGSDAGDGGTAPTGGVPDGPRSGTTDPLGDVDARFAGIVAGLRAEVRPRSWTPDSTTAEVDDSHFEPPDPGPVLGGDPLLTVAWVAVLALPLVLLLGVLVWNPLPGIVLQTCVVGFLGGLALLLWRMPRHRDDDDPGAVV